MNASAALDRPPPTRHAPIALWRVAEAFMHTLYALFGAPEDVAAKHTLTRAPYLLLLSWIRCAEAMLRRLLLIEAAAFPKPNTRPLLHQPRHRARKLMGFDADKPEHWRVSFRCLLDRRRPRRQTVHAGEAPAIQKKRVSREERWNYTNFKPQTFHSAWPLAERYEALIRVFNNPEPYARRLARQLHATPHRARELMRAPPEAEHRVENYDALRHSAEAARCQAFNSS